MTTHRRSTSLGGALLAIGGFLLVPLTTRTGSVYLLATYAIFGVGAGMVFPPITSTAISGLPPDQVGVGFTNSSHVAWAVLGGCGLVALALAGISTSNWAKAATARNGQRFATALIPESQGHPLPSRSADPTEARTAITAKRERPGGRGILISDRSQPPGILHRTGARQAIRAPAWGPQALAWISDASHPKAIPAGA